MTNKVMLKVGAPLTGDPVVGNIGDEKMILSGKRPPIVEKFDIRDRLFELIGKGNSLKPDDKAAIYGYLSNTLGQDKAKKVMDHAYIFNTRADVQKLPIEEKLNTFFTVGSNDPDVMEIIGKTKNLGYGTAHGFRTSSSDMNQQLSGHNPLVAGSGVNPEIQKKVLLKIRK
jgi:hypothetical protein